MNLRESDVETTPKDLREYFELSEAEHLHRIQGTITQLISANILPISEPSSRQDGHVEFSGNEEVQGTISSSVSATNSADFGCFSKLNVVH